MAEPKPIPADAGQVDFGELSPEQQQVAMSDPRGVIQVRSTGQVYRVTNIPALPEVEAPAPQQVLPASDPRGAAKVELAKALAQSAAQTRERVKQAQDPLHLGALAEHAVTWQRREAEGRAKQALSPVEAKGSKKVAGKAQPLNPQELAELRALEQQFSGAPGGPPNVGPLQPLTIGTGGSTRESPDLPAAAADRARTNLKNRRLQVSGALGAKNAALSAEATVQQDLAAQFEPLVRQYAARAPQLLKRYDALQQSLDRARQRIEQMNIDPQRLLRSMPTTSKVLWGFGAMFGAGVGNRQPMDLLERAIDRDIAAQRSNIQRAIQSANLTQAQANALWNQYTHFEQSRRQAMLDVSRFKLGAAAVATKKADAMLAYADAMRDLDKAEVGIDKAATGKVTKRYQTQINPVAVAQRKALMAASMSAGAAPKINRVIDKEVRQEVADLDTGVQKIAYIKSLLTKGGEHPLFWKGMPNNVATEIAQELRELALSKRRALGDSGPVVISDFKNYGIPGTADKLARFLERTQLLSRLDRAASVMQRRKFTVLRTKLGPMSNILSRAVEEASQPPTPTAAAPAGGRAQ